MYLTCTTSIPFLPALLLPFETPSWIRPPKTQANKQNYITEGPVKPMSHRFDDRQLSLSPHIYHGERHRRERQPVIYYKY